MASIAQRWDGVVDRYQSQPRIIKIIAVTLLLVLAYALPLLRPPILTTNSIDFGTVMFRVVAFALVALGLNIVIGYAGLLDLGYVGFYACGAYTTAVLTVYHGSWPFFLALPVAIAVTMLTGVLLGAPTLRVRGDYLAIVTLGFGEIIRIAVTNVEWLGAAAGIKNIHTRPASVRSPHRRSTRAGSSSCPVSSGTASSRRWTPSARQPSCPSARGTRCPTTGSS